MNKKEYNYYRFFKREVVPFLFITSAEELAGDQKKYGIDSIIIYFNDIDYSYVNRTQYEEYSEKYCKEIINNENMVSTQFEEYNKYLDMLARFIEEDIRERKIDLVTLFNRVKEFLIKISGTINIQRDYLEEKLRDTLSDILKRKTKQYVDIEISRLCRPIEESPGFKEQNALLELAIVARKILDKNMVRREYILKRDGLLRELKNELSKIKTEIEKGCYDEHIYLYKSFVEEKIDKRLRKIITERKDDELFGRKWFEKYWNLKDSEISRVVKEKIDQYPDIISKLKRHYNDFEWIEKDWGFGKGLVWEKTCEQFVKYIIEEPEIELIKRQMQYPFWNREREVLITHYSNEKDRFKKECIPIIKFLVEEEKLRLKRRWIQTKLYHYLEPIIEKEVIGSYNEKLRKEGQNEEIIKKNEISSLTVDEILTILNNKNISRKTINDRRKSYVIHIVNDKQQIEGEDKIYKAKEYFERLKESGDIYWPTPIPTTYVGRIETVGRPKGFHDKKSGIARIIKYYDDLYKVEKCDILIKTMVTPLDVRMSSHLVSGVVTDEGTVTSHVHTLLHESGIPFITDMKDLSERLPDDNYDVEIEVDFENAIVSVISIKRGKKNNV